MAAETKTLTNALLDDLDDLSDEEEEEEEEQELTTGTSKPEGNEGKAEKPSYTNDAALLRHLQTIEERPNDNDLIVPSNKFLVNLGDHISKTHLKLQQAYQPKFPELADLLGDAKEYQEAVQAIGNQMDITKVENLDDVLSSKQIISISVAGSTTNGRPLTQDEWDQVDGHCQELNQLRTLQTRLISFVENRMQDWAPNTAALVGPAVAAQLIGLAGGLVELSRIPSCNLQVMGQQQQHQAGGYSARLHQGVLQQCDLVQSCPSSLRKKALKVVAAKLALAIRCDFCNVQTGRTSAPSTSGQAFRAEIETKFAAWLTPDKAPTLKALPKPDLTTKKRRGGKRMRRMKERFEETAMMKKANNRSFSEQTGEYGDDAMGLTMGMLESEGGGELRKKTEKRKMRHANTKASRKRQAQMAASSASGTATNNGLASSMVFTPVQGMELVDPQAQMDRVKQANNKWFSDNAGFQSALPKK